MLRGVSRRCVPPPPPLTTNNGYASGAKSPSGQALEGSESSDIGQYIPPYGVDQGPFTDIIWAL